MYIYLICALSGVRGIGAPLPGLPAWAGWSWYALLIFGGVVGAVGVYWRDGITGLLITRAAMVPLGFGAYAWGVTQFWLSLHQVGWLGAALIGVTIAGFGFAAHRNAIQITRYVRLAGVLR